MRPFVFERARSLADAIMAATDPETALIAGGTELVNWMKEGIASPARVVDINGLSELRGRSNFTTTDCAWERWRG
jgi:xanthine dehydrogenase YagS FAD-binding subunit